MDFTVFFSLKRLSLFFLLLFLFQSCANIVPPEGGKKDETPPVLLSIFPKDSSLQKKISKIELRFNKFMVVKVLENNLQLSPLIRINPGILSYGKRVEIKIVDSFLEDNTTYKLSLGDALVDNRESTPYKNFTYIFSTGNYFDSLTLKGKVFDAKTGKPAEKATVVLYKSGSPDSSIIRERPMYVQKADGSGIFEFTVLPNRSFKVYAIEDENNNYIYDAGEKISFIDSIIIPGKGMDSLLNFYLFKEIEDSVLSGIDSDSTYIDSLKNNAESPIDSVPNTASSGKPTAGKPAAGNLETKRSDAGKQPDNKNRYVVQVDTIHKDVGTLDIRNDLEISYAVGITFDTGKIFLSFDDKGIEVQALIKIRKEKEVLTINTPWLENHLYTLRLVKSWAKDSSGAELLPGKYIFRTKSKNDYGTLKIRFDSLYVAHDYVLMVFNGEDSVFQSTIDSTLITLPLLEPGNYTMRIFQDTNKNGKWDTGNLFEKRHPERVYPYAQEIIIKKSWENEVDFKVGTPTKPKAGEETDLDKGPE